MLEGRRNPFVAREGIPFLLGAALLTGVVLYTWGAAYTALPAALLAWLFLVFRDPDRRVPPDPLGVVSPVDGLILNVDVTDAGAAQREAVRILIRVNSLGTYTARSPIEGKLMDLQCDGPDGGRTLDRDGLWLRTDEGDDVVLKFRGRRFGLAPHAFPRYGERLGQGQRCAYLRLTRLAEVELPISSRILVEPGRRVIAGEDLLARLPRP